MKHIKALDASQVELGAVVAECGEVVAWGTWEDSRTYRCKMFEGAPASDFCAECQREWVRQHTFLVRMQDPPKPKV